MVDLQMVLSEAVKLNQSISQFLKFSTYTDYGDLSGLDIDFLVWIFCGSKYITLRVL